MPIGTILSLIVALLLNLEKLKLREFFKAVYFLPVVTTMAAIAIVWQRLYQTQFGLFNYLLSLMGIPKIGWLLDKKTVLLSIVIMTVWKNLGYYAIIFLAGLQMIPEIYYEAAIIDGANKFQCFKNITLPLSKPTTMFVIVMSTISAFQTFDQIYIMTEGGPMNSTKVVVLQVFQSAFEFFRFGYASAMAVILLIFILAMTIIQIKFS